MDQTHLIVEAGVRYWEDATVMGQEDANGDLMPLVRGGKWCPIIELATGQIVGWPPGITADIHYKVCDEGEYWIGDASGRKATRTYAYVGGGSLSSASSRMLQCIVVRTRDQASGVAVMAASSEPSQFAHRTYQMIKSAPKPHLHHPS
jgi:hypothetical protein